MNRSFPLVSKLGGGIKNKKIKAPEPPKLLHKLGLENEDYEQAFLIL